VNGTDPVAPTQTDHRLRGLLADGSPMIDPTTAQVTRYAVPGDPVTAAGWLDTNPADRRMMVSTGPLALAPGETRTLWAAIVIGRGGDRLASITALRFFDDQVQSFFDDHVAGVGPSAPGLTNVRVWPNPGAEFAVGFGLGRPGRVRATVHDLGGRRVALIADREFPAGPHVLHWDGRLRSSAPGGSGVYWLELETPDGRAARKLVRLR
jgi:hypothetical protein